MAYAERILLLELAVLVAMPLAAEVGLRVGLRRAPPRDETLTAQVGIVQATSFAILGLLAAFAIAMAEERFDARRQLIRDEANAIHTSYLRSQYVPEPHRSDLSRLLRAYVDTRIAFYDRRDDVDAVERALATGVHLQREIWAHVVVIVRDTPSHGDTNAELVESVNEMIELEGSRLDAIFNHVPLTVTVLVVVIGLFSCATTGFGCGLAGRRVHLAVVLLPVLVAITICVLVDLDTPRIGLIQTGQEPLLRVQAALAADVP